MFKKIFQINQGMTLVEILVAVFILTVGILGSLLFFARAMTSVSTAKDLTLATAHAESLLEEMRGRSTLINIQQTDWSRWAEAQGFNALPQEKVEVHYDNPGGNPLKVKTKVSWQRASQSGWMALDTEIIK